MCRAFLLGLKPFVKWLLQIFNIAKSALAHKRNCENRMCSRVGENVLVWRWRSHGSVFAVFLVLRCHGRFRIFISLVFSGHGLFETVTRYNI